MKQSNNKKSRDVTAFLYERLSRDDNLEGESYSIGNQKKLLAKVAKEKGYTNLVHFLDDGISGVTMDRPGFVEMICQLEQGKAAAVFVKDLSRLGRNYIEVGRLTEEFFPDHDIRLVAVSDNIDTAEGENELAPIRNLFNEWYARDISKKRRISNKIKGNAGEPMGQPPYGYIKDPNDPKHWIVDDEAAQVVRRVYSMTLEGFGTEQIAAQLEKDDVLTPRAYWLTKGIKRPGKGKQQPPTKWNSSTITKILSLQEYCGDILNFKTYSKSYKNKKRIDNDRENWVVFQDVHEAIIERAVYEQVQQKRGKIRKRRTNKNKDHERNDQKIEHLREEGAVLEHRRARGLRFGERGVGVPVEREKKIAEVDPAGQHADERHDDVVDERCDDLPERAADNDADRHIDHVPLYGEVLEFLE